jgi:hypothetical protein
MGIITHFYKNRFVEIDKDDGKSGWSLRQNYKASKTPIPLEGWMGQMC